MKKMLFLCMLILCCGNADVRAVPLLRVLHRKRRHPVSEVTLHIVDLLFASAVAVEVVVGETAHFKRFRFSVPHAFAAHDDDPQNYEAYVVIEEQQDDGSYAQIGASWMSSLYEGRSTDPCVPGYWITLTAGKV